MITSMSGDRQLISVYGNGVGQLADVRRGVLPESFVGKYPQEASFIRALTDPNPELRPTTAQILTTTELYAASDESVRLLRRAVRNGRIRMILRRGFGCACVLQAVPRLKRELAEKDRTILALQRRLQQLEGGGAGGGGGAAVTTPFAQPSIAVAVGQQPSVDATATALGSLPRRSELTAALQATNATSSSTASSSSAAETESSPSSSSSMPAATTGSVAVPRPLAAAVGGGGGELEFVAATTAAAAPTNSSPATRTAKAL
jgi:hypothetical protein